MHKEKIHHIKNRRMAVLVFFTLLFSPLISFAQSSLPTDTMVFIWAQDTESAELAPLGSGFLISDRGYILTAKHVVKEDEDGKSVINIGERIVVSVKSKSAFPIRIEKTEITCANKPVDICAIRIPTDSTRKGVIYFNLGCYRPAKGEALRALGFYGGSNRFGGANEPDGKITADDAPGGLIPTNIDVVPTMSGGPVFDRTGQVIGIVKGALKDSDNLTFVTPLHRVSSILQDLGVFCSEVPGITLGHCNSKTDQVDPKMLQNVKCLQ